MNTDRQWSLIINDITQDQWSLLWNAVDHTWSVLINGLYREPYLGHLFKGELSKFKWPFAWIWGVLELFCMLTEKHICKQDLWCCHSRVHDITHWSTLIMYDQRHFIATIIDLELCHLWLKVKWIGNTF